MIQLLLIVEDGNSREDCFPVSLSYFPSIHAFDFRCRLHTIVTFFLLVIVGVAGNIKNKERFGGDDGMIDDRRCIFSRGNSYRVLYPADHSAIESNEMRS